MEEEPELCIYCLERAGDTRDHVVPRAFGQNPFTVPCCLPCNIKINDRVYYTFEERRAAALGVEGSLTPNERQRRAFTEKGIAAVRRSWQPGGTHYESNRGKRDEVYGEPLGYHPTKNQRAMVAAVAIAQGEPSGTQTELAALYGIDQPLLSRALTVLRLAPELSGPVVTAEMTLEAAAAQARQREVTGQGGQRPQPGAATAEADAEAVQSAR